MTPTVIVPHYGPDRLLEQCRSALDRHYPDVEVIVHDGNVANFGFAGNCNRAARLASGDRLVFLNNDCVVDAGWLEPLLSPDWPLCGSLLRYPDGRVQHAGVNVLRLPAGLLAKNITTPRPSGTADAVTGASLSVDADLFWSLGGFDEGFWNGYEDVDLCLAAREATGRRAWLAAESTAVHLESASGAERWTRVQANVDRLNEKWGD